MRAYWPVAHWRHTVAAAAGAEGEAEQVQALEASIESLRARQQAALRLELAHHDGGATVRSDG